MYPENASLATHIAVVSIGTLVGGIGGFAGIGGGPFMVAFLRLFVGTCPHLAQGTVLAVMLPPMSALGVFNMRDRAKVLWRQCIPAFFSYCAFSYIGAELAFLLPGDGMGIVFGAFLCLLGMKYGSGVLGAKKSKRETSNAAVSDSAGGDDNDHEEDAPSRSDLEAGEIHLEEANDSPRNSPAPSLDVIDDLPSKTATDSCGIAYNAHGPTLTGAEPLVTFSYKNIGIIGGIIGVFGGFLGIGAGVLMVPIFTELCLLHKDDARTMSLMILLPPVSLGAVLKYSHMNQVDWMLATVLFFTYFFSNYFGSKLGRKCDTATFKSVLGVSLALLGLIILGFAFIADPWGDPERCVA